MDDEGTKIFRNDFEILYHDDCMPDNSGAHQGAVICTQDAGVKTDRHYVDEVRRELHLLRDTSEMFTLFCREKEGLIDTLFSKLQDTGIGHKEEDVNKLKEHVREYVCRCIFENGKVFVLKEAVLNITEEYIDGMKVVPKVVEELQEELQKLMQLTENKGKRHELYSQALKDHDHKMSNRFYVDMLEQNISVMKTEAKDFGEYCDQKDSKIKYHLQVLFKQEQEGGFTDLYQQERETAMKMLIKSSKSYFRKFCSVKGKIIILEKQCERANLHSNNAECSEVVMQFEKELGFLKDLHEKRFEEFKNNDKDIASKELILQKSFIDEIGRLNKQLHSRCEHEAKLLKQLELTEANADDFAKQLDDIKSLGDDNKKLNETIKQLDEKLHATQSSSSELLHELQTQKSNTDHLHRKFRQQLLYAQNSTRLLDESRKECGELKKENNSLVLRLSKIAGDNLTYQNPNIADLGDPRRPTKLAEVYNELYDNEWTDAFDRFGDLADTDKVQRMLTIMKLADDHCGELYKQHTDAVRNGLTTLSIKYKTKVKVATDMKRGDDDKTETPRKTVKYDTNTEATRKERDILEDGAVRNDGKSSEQDNQEQNSGRDARENPAPLTQHDGAGKGDGKSADNQGQNSGMNVHSNSGPLTQLINYEEKTEEIPFEFDDLNNTQKQAIADIGRFVQNALEEKVVEVTSKVIVEEMELPEVSEIFSYVRKCVTFCWSARLHDLPVYIDFMEVTEDTLLDLNVYKPYTKKGKLVDYVVWPPIYLHKGGPMLSKGVAQGKN